MKYTFPLVLAATLCLSACGNKGPLVMPQQPVPVDTASAAPPAATPDAPATPDAAPELPAETQTVPADTAAPAPDPK